MERTMGRPEHGGAAGSTGREQRRSGLDRFLDRFLGDALIAAMVLLGLMFCVGAARAEGPACVAGAASVLQRCV